MPKKKTDDQVALLLADVQRRKTEIAKAEKPRWQTNCSFAAPALGTVNIQVEASIVTLIRILAIIRSAERDYKEAASVLNLTAVPEFKWQNSTVEEWTADIKARITKLEIGAKQAQLQVLEDRLNKIVTPELRAQMELAAIHQELTQA